jgi:hypothetical protein
LLSLRDSNGNWTVNYDTAYSGLYFINLGGSDGGGGGGGDNIAVNTVEWFFKDYNHSSILSYHMVETETIPDKYDVDFVDYHIK